LTARSAETRKGWFEMAATGVDISVGQYSSTAPPLMGATIAIVVAGRVVSG
jgi:hypothetical protein